MPLINTSLPNLIQGVSQQPDATRYAGQCEEQVNALSSVVDGLTKRPNTRHVARLLNEDDYSGESGAVGADTFVHFIDRDDAEKYVVLHDGTKMRAYNLFDGTQASIKVGDTTHTDGYTVDAGHYLSAPLPDKQLKAVTVADSTFLLNSTIAVAPTATKTDALEKKGFVYVNQGDYEKKYTIKLETAAAQDPETAAVITLNLEKYEAGTIWGGHWRTYPYYQYRVASVTVNNVGAGYEAGTVPTITVTSKDGDGDPLDIYKAPVLIPVMTSSGTVQSVTVVDGGEFQGVDGGDIDEVGDGAPTVEGAVGTIGTTASGTAFASITHTSLAADHADGGANVDTTVIAGALADLAATAEFSGSAFTVEYPSGSNVVIFTLKDGLTTDFTLTTTDGLSDTGLQAVYKEIDSIGNLPAKAPNNFKIKVRGDADLNEDDYYVQFKTTGGESYGDGTWEEAVGFEVAKGIKASTLPHLLVNTALNEFEIKEMDTKERVAGDDSSNPLPSFIGRPLSGMFFYKARLGFLSDDTVTTTESGLGVRNDAGNMVYNFSRLTVTTLLDTAPIDISVAHNTVTKLRDALAFQENLILFSDNGQFVLKGGDLLTPKTVSITPVTHFETSSNIAPISLGAYIYFPFERANFTGVREYSLNANTDVYDSVEITEHTPHYIPKNITAFVGSSAEDVMCLLSEDEPGSLYVYKYFFSGQKKILSSWFKFTLDGNIRGIEFIGSSLYLVVTDADSAKETNLLEIPFSAGTTDSAAVAHMTYLDMRVPAKVLNGATAVKFPTYTARAERPLRASVSVYDQTVAPYSPAIDSLSVVTENGAALSCSTTADGTVTLTSAVEADTLVWVGVSYMMSYTFSEQIFKAPVGQGQSPSASTRIQVRNGSLYYNNTGHFNVKVTPEHRDTYTNTFSPTIVGASLLGTLNLESGFYRFPVFTGPQDTVITIENDTALPSNFQSAEFESFIHSRSNRYG